MRVPYSSSGGVIQPCAQFASMTHDLCYRGHEVLKLVWDPLHCHIDNIDMSHNFVQHHVTMWLFDTVEVLTQQICGAGLENVKVICRSPVPRSWHKIFQNWVQKSKNLDVIFEVTRSEFRVCLKTSKKIRSIRL